MHIVDEVHSAVKRKFYSRDSIDVVDRQKLPTISLPNGKFLNNYVKPLFRANNCRVVTNSQSTIRRKLVHNRPPQPPDACGVVYKIPCKNCDLCYFGQTGRGLEVRLGEHKADVRHKRNKNACYKHTFLKNHSIDWENSKALYKSNSLQNRLVVESTLINSQQNFNNMRSTLNIEKLASKIILKSNPKLTTPG